MNIREDDFMDEEKDRVEDYLMEPLNRRTSEFQELHLKYSYSGISDASSTGDFALGTIKSFYEEPVKLNFVEA